MRTAAGYVIAAAIIVAAFFIGRRCGREAGTAVTADTVRIVDTVVVVEPRPIYTEVVRTDTVLLAVPADTVRVPVVIPIERRVYAAPEYRAVVSGYQPRLDSITVYPQTQIVTITKEAERRRWGVGIQAGIGIPAGTWRPAPYIGIGIQYTLFSW